jgi:isopenicillin-N epimerase
MVSAALPADTDINLLKARLYDEHHIEVPLIDWNGNKLIRVSVQGYNSKRDIDQLCRALTLLVG